MEQTLTTKLQSQRANLNKLLEAITELEREITLVRKRKSLLYGTGKILEDQVILILNEIGFQAERGTQGRSDILLHYKDKIGVAEVKGVRKSAAERHASQLEKWVSEYYAEHGVQPKGFLVVNPFYEIPPTERTEPPFPHQMLAYSQVRGHCLITTTQLLCIFLDIQKDSSRREEIIKKLFETVGEYEGHKNIAELQCQELEP